MRKENAADCTNKQKKPVEKEAIQNAGEEGKEQASVTESSQEEHKPEESKAEERPAGEEQGKNSDAKREAEKTEVEPCPETSHVEQGKFNLRGILCSLMLSVSKHASPSSTNLCGCLS